MNKKPIEEAQDPDLRLSRKILLRAAREARELAELTGTEIFDNGLQETRSAEVREDGSAYERKP